MWWKQNQWKVIVPVLIAAVLAASFWYGGGAPGLQGWTVEGDTPSVAAATQMPIEVPATPKNSAAPDQTPENSAAPNQTLEDIGEKQPDSPPADAPEETPEPAETPTEGPVGLASRPGGTEGGMTAQEKIGTAKELAGESSSGVEAGDKDYSESQGMVLDATTGKDQYLTDPVPEGKPVPVEPQDAEISDVAYSCTLSISCATILNHMDWLSPEKVELVPADGWILPPTQATFYEGESVFHVLRRVCKQNKIHMEFSNTPLYNSAYIEGIHNLYEFDCGELSGWMYQVNEWFPNYGCSRYALKDGDVICWVYTCDLGVDVGGFYSTGG